MNKQQDDRRQECWMCGAWGSVELDRRGRCVDRIACDGRAAAALKKAEILGPAFAPRSSGAIPPRGTPFKSPTPRLRIYDPRSVVIIFKGIELLGYDVVP
jgi:hypothetical protein